MSEYIEYLKEVFDQFGPIQPRRMFGGYGIFHNGLMLGLVFDDILYLKADDSASKYFEERGLDPFHYVKNDKTIQMSYYMAPDEIFDDPEEAKIWAIRSYEAATRSKRPVKKNQKKIRQT